VSTAQLSLIKEGGMSTIQRFQDVEAWQRARELTRAIYHFTGAAPFSRDYGLCDQIRRASVSTMSNIAEGFERGGSAEFAHFLSIAKGSAGEVESQLYVALDQEYISHDEFSQMETLVISLKKLLAGFMKYLRESDLRGHKFK
jgi:four helix bundle protein